MVTEQLLTKATAALASPWYETKPASPCCSPLPLLPSAFASSPTSLPTHLAAAPPHGAMYTSCGTSSGFSAKYSLAYAASTLYLRQYGSEAARQYMVSLSSNGLYGSSTTAPYHTSPRPCPAPPSWDLASQQSAPAPQPPGPLTLANCLALPLPCHLLAVHDLAAPRSWVRP